MVKYSDEPNKENGNSAVLVQFQNGAREDLRQQLAMEVTPTAYPVRRKNLLHTPCALGARP